MEFIKKFKSDKDWMERLTMARGLSNKHHNCIPVIVDRLKKTTPMPLKNKFLAPKNLTGGELMSVVRKHIGELKPEQAIYMFVGNTNTLFPNSMSLIDIYTQNKEIDDFLYIVYDIESTFGNS